MTEALPCPENELLIGYVSGDIPVVDLGPIEVHLRTCDRCVDTVRVVHLRLRAAREASQPPPVEVQVRARAALHTAGKVTQPRRVPVLLRLPILVPLSLAAGALLVVATHTWFEPPQARVLNRTVQVQRVTHTARVHAHPSGQAQVVAALNAGEIVEVHAMQTGWVRIALPDGREGWVEAGALE